MKNRITLTALLLTFLTSSLTGQAQTKDLPRIAIAGIATESSTFSPP